MCCDEKVLIIESDPELCEQAADFLWEEGFKVESASDDAGWRRRMDGGDFDIVILDQKMGGAGGMETARQIKVMAPGARIYMTDGRNITDTLRMAENISGLAQGEPARHGRGFAEVRAND
jgi:DNA-binding response OmpR family regulator